MFWNTEFLLDSPCNVFYHRYVLRFIADFHQLASILMLEEEENEEQNVENVEERIGVGRDGTSSDVHRYVS